MTIVIPMRLPSSANLREHYMVKAKRVKQQRQFVSVYLAGRPRPALPVVVTLVRIAPRALDGDNLQSAFKAPRDEIARWLGCQDNDPRVTWVYGQKRAGVGVYSVVVTVEGRAGCEDPSSIEYWLARDWSADEAREMARGGRR
jgi:hypothetical protein